MECICLRDGRRGVARDISVFFGLLGLSARDVDQRYSTFTDYLRTLRAQRQVNVVDDVSLEA